MEAPRLNSWSSSGGRVETGAIRFEGDLPGIFIRGEEAWAFAASVISILRDNADRITAHHVFELGNVLITTHTVPRARELMQQRLVFAREQFLDSLAKRGKL